MYRRKPGPKKKKKLYVNRIDFKVGKLKLIQFSTPEGIKTCSRTFDDASVRGIDPADLTGSFAFPLVFTANFNRKKKKGEEGNGMYYGYEDFLSFLCGSNCVVPDKIGIEKI